MVYNELSKCGRQDTAYRVIKVVNNIKINVVNSQNLKVAEEEIHFTGDLAPGDRDHHTRSVLQAGSG